jgi:hypothetical protein
MQKERASKNETIGVYEPQTPSDCPPNRFMDLEDADRLVNNGDATRINRGKAVRLRRCSQAVQLENPARLRGLSAAPDAALIERHAMAHNSGFDDAAIVAVEAWRERATPQLSHQNWRRQ